MTASYVLFKSCYVLALCFFAWCLSMRTTVYDIVSHIKWTKACSKAINSFIVHVPLLTHHHSWVTALFRCSASKAAAAQRVQRIFCYTCSFPSEQGLLSGIFFASHIALDMECRRHFAHLNFCMTFNYVFGMSDIFLWKFCRRTSAYLPRLKLTS